MVIPFSNTKLRVPPGFQSLLVGLSTEVLRSQPRNIHAFAAEYFEKLLQRRDQGHSTGLEKHSALEDRYYNNKSFQEEYPVNDPEVNQAATKIQANFRGHKARREVETLKRDNKQTIDTDQQDLGYHRDDTSASPREHHDQHPSSRPASARHPSEPVSEQNDQHGDPNQYQEEELTEAEKEEQDRAARAIQARFRGHREKKSATEQIQSPPQSTRTSDESARGYHQDLETERTPTGNVSEREEFRHHPEDMFGGDTDDLDRPRFEREPTQLSEDFERHTQLPRDSDFGREVDEHHREGEVEHQEEDEDDMADPSLEKAATRIQATFRGYKTRKELGPHPHQSPTTAEHEHHQTEHEDEHATTHEPDDEETAAVKIQAAFRGYRTRKELDK